MSGKAFKSAPRHLVQRGTFFVTMLWLAAIAENVSAQAPQAREYPNERYYACFRLLDDGDYVEAESAFRAVARTGIRSSAGSWIDSICYFTMVGECYYHMGDLAGALEQYTNAIRLYLAESTWMFRVGFPASLDPSAMRLRTPVNWGPSQRQTAIARLPQRYTILQGLVNIPQVLQQGGVLTQPEAILINANEIARCTALAIRRRAEIMGRACKHDPLTEQLVNTLAVRPAQPNHWSQGWISAFLGLAYVSAGRHPEAIAELTNALQVDKQFDHPLTPEILVELGKLAFQQQQYNTAATMFLEATLSAPWFDQHDVMAEAFRWGALTHLVTGPNGIYPPLDAAIAWARRERVPALEAELLIAQAQNAAELNQPAAAAALIDRARRAMTRSEMSKGATGARFNYVAALVSFQAGNLAAGEAAWKDVAAYQVNPRRIGSQRLFEIGLVDNLATSGRLSLRASSELYADVLREPTKTDWTTNPVETLTTVLGPNFNAYEHWLNLELERKELDRAAEIADRIRRLRFYSTLPMGGRLLSLAWVLEAPREALSDAANLQRQELLTRFPNYARAAQQSAQIRAELSRLPVVPPNPDEVKAQQKKWAEWATVSQLQELMIREIALRREPADFAFPPPLNCTQLQASLSAEQAVLAFLLTSQNQLHTFLISKTGCEHWRIDNANRMQKDISELLKECGQFDRNTTVELELIKGNAWEEPAGKLWDLLGNKAGSGVTRNFQEIVIVPDRFLWYLPFEALPSGEKKTPLLTSLRIRYVPTASLALPDKRPASVLKDTLVVTGKMVSHEDVPRAVETAAELRKVLNQVTELSGSLPAPSALISALGYRTLVLHDAGGQVSTAYEWAPLQLDQEKPGGALAQWLALPWGAPDQIVLPGFHSAAEASLRRGSSGDDIFLTVCGLMAAGSRTVLLSRWRTGGQTSYDLMREFVQELPYSSASNAWQRSVSLVKERELRVDREPRVKGSGEEANIKATHPFFWAGYLLADTGATPKVDEGKKK